ncbi:MAG: hypothetical protein QXL69_06770 [Candidatus Bathyarchaeia archaeon]
MYIPPPPIICPLGPYPYCWLCRNYFDCPFVYLPPVRYPVVITPVIRAPSCPFCLTPLVWSSYYKRWWCSRCALFI